MKPFFAGRILPVAVFFAVCILSDALASEVVTFNITPSAVSNSYNGAITLQISGLTNGETVNFQKFLDVNTNGIVDAGDLLVEAGNLTDGKANVFTNGSTLVTNFNTGPDLNSATGAITAQLIFQNGDFMQDTIGQYAFVISSPTGNFTAITNLFDVTNFPYAQTVTGNVVSNGVAVPNAVVIIFGPPRGGDHGPGDALATVVANNAGAYTVKLPTGTYVPMAFKSNYVANYSASPTLVLTNNQTITTNVVLTNATATISGRFVDANNTSKGLGGVFAPTSSDSGMIAAGFTDTNGNFNLRVASSGSWNVGSDSSGLTVHGYVGYQNDPTNVSAGTTGITVGFPKESAIFYGSVTDNFGNPLPGIDISVSDMTSNLYEVDAYVFTNGNYVAAAVANGETWQLQVGNGFNPLATNYVFSTASAAQNGGVTPTYGQAVQANISAIVATNHITGHVQDNFGNPITGVSLSASAQINGTGYFPLEVETDTNGNYAFNVPNASWSVQVSDSCNGPNNNNPLSSNYQCPNPQNVTILNNNGLANFTVQTNNTSGSLQVATSSPLTSGTIGAAYSQQLNATGGSPPSPGNYSWSQVSGSLPPGLNLDPNGFINGTPTTSGTFNFTLQVSDQNNSTANKSFALTINNGALQVTTTSLSVGISNVVYSQQLTASGGQPFSSGIYSWTNISGKLPTGLTLATNGIISGTPTVVGTSNFTVRVTDSLSATATQALSLTIIPPTTNVSFSVTPSAVSNTYGGKLTLQVTGSGLNTGETVTVQQYADLNTNGVIDAGDLLLQQFNLTDGQASVFTDGATSVTNLNVPGDFNSATGAITALLNFNSNFGNQNVVGQYIYKLSSPSGHFLPLTTGFSITNFAYAQSFTGTVVSNGTSTTLPNTIVLLATFSADGGLNVKGGTMSDNSGNFTIKAPAGTNYLLFGVKSNFVASTSVPLLTLTNGATFTTNVNLLAATNTISGRIVDSNNTSIGLPGISGGVMSTNNLLTVYFGDANGNFSVKVTGSQWKIEGSDNLLAMHGYVNFQDNTNVNTSTGSVAGVVISATQSTALFYGSVKDVFGNPLTGVNIYANDSGQYESSGYTDTNGSYYAGVLAGENWQEYVDNNQDENPANYNYDYTQPQIDQNGGTNLNVGQAANISYTAIQATNHITGFVRDSNNNPLVGIGVYGTATIGGVYYTSLEADTDTNGNYSMNVANGNWTVNVNWGYGDSTSLSTNYLDPNMQNVTILNNNGAANFTVQTNIASGSLQVTTTSLPNGTNGFAYSQQLNAIGGQSPYSWTSISGSLPAGLSLQSGGFISGTPASGGIFSFTVQVTDNLGSTANKALSLTVNTTNAPLQITTTSLTNGTTGLAYSQALNATGGQTPYTWTNISGSFPPGLTLAANGVISGTPTTNGNFNFTAKVTDALSATATQVLSLVVNPKPVLGLPNWLTNRFSIWLNGASNQNYTLQMSTNLSSTNWISLFTTNNSATNSFIVTDPNATNQQRFYRIKTGP